MDELITSGWGVVLLIGGAAILFNVGLIYAVLSGSASKQIEMFRRITQRARNPWKDAEDSLIELRNRMSRMEDSDSARTDDE
jgi:hypothetical protein